MKIIKRILNTLKQSAILLGRNFFKFFKFIVNPKKVFKAGMQKQVEIKLFLKKLPKNTLEYFFLMVMRADSYAQRLQRKNPKAQIKEFEIKEYQKHLRKKTFKVVLTSALTIMLVISIPGLFTKYFAQSKGYQWIQTSWVGGSTSPVDTSTNLLTGWTKYFSKSKNNAVIADAAGVNLANVAATNVAESASGTYTAGVYSGGTYSGVNSATGGGVYSKSGVVKLKKPATAACSGNEECASGVCQTTCIPPCNATIGNGQSCAYSGLVYGIITGADGKLWMDRNLGATRVATAPTDIQAYGWLFQWGRKADGHQYTGRSGTPTPPAISNNVANTTAGIIDGATYTVNSPNTANFLTSTCSDAGYYNCDWLSDAQKNDTLWAGANGGINNPCPPGFRVPTGGTYTGVVDGNGAMQGEWAHLVALAGITNQNTAFNSNLKLPLTGVRDRGGVIGYEGTHTYYWSSRPYPVDEYTPSDAYILYIHSSGVDNSMSQLRSYGLAVRCLKN